MSNAYIRFLFLTFALIVSAPWLPAQTTNDLPGRDIVKLLPDYGRPRVYALNVGTSTGTGSLVALDGTTGAFVNEITLGTTPTDMEIDPSGNSLYVIHFGNNTISRVNLASFSVAETRSFPPPGNNGGDHYNIECGPGGLIYWLDAKWAPALHIMNFATGAEVGGWDTGEGFGDLVLKPGSKDLFVWRQYGWSAGSANSWIWRLTVTNNPPSILDTSTVGFGRDPLDSPILMSANGDRVFRNQYALYTTNLSAVAVTFPNSDVIYGIDYFGLLAFSSTKVYNARTGNPVYTLPFSSTVQTVSGDQEQLFLYQGSGRKIVTIPISSIAPLPNTRIEPVPADNATISAPLPELSWSWPPGAFSFRVYFGTSETAVATATMSSSLYLGEVSTPRIPFQQTLAEGRSYYWRVDAVGLTGVVTNAVWRFRVAPLSSTPQTVQAAGISGFDARPQTLALTSTLGPQAWSLSENIPWLTASSTAGVTPAAVELRFSSANLSPGRYEGSVSIASDSATIMISVSLEVAALDLIKMTADYKRPYIYALQRSPTPGKPASVLVINTTTEAIENVLPILTDPRDLCVHPREDKLYVVDWLTGYLRVVDLKTQTPLPSLAVYVGLDRVNPGPAGRVLMEDWNQWVGLFAIDTTVTTNGILPQLAMLREGDGETSPDGRFYYHCDNNISSAAVSKWSLEGAFAQVGGSSTSHPFGSRLLYLSPDGTRLFWQGFMYDTALSGPNNNAMQELAGFGQQIWASTSNAWFAVGDSAVFDTRSVAAIHNLGFNTGVKAVSADDQKLFQYDPTSRRMVVVPMSTILSPKVTSHPQSQTVTIGANAHFNAAAQGASPLTYQWLFNNTPVSGATNLLFDVFNVSASRAGDYALRVSNPWGSVTSAVGTLTVITPPSIVRAPTNITTAAGATVLFTVVAEGSSPLRYQWQFEGANLPGATNSSLSLPNVQAQQAGAYRVVVANTAGTVTSSTAILRVNPRAPEFVEQPENSSVNAGGTALLKAVPIGSSPLSVRWFFNGAPLPGVTTVPLLITNAQAAQAGPYFCVAENIYGVATSSVARLTIVPQAPAIVTQPISRTVLAGEQVQFSVKAQGSEPFSFQWRHNSTALPGGLQSSLLLSNVQPEHAGLYDVLVSNPQGTTTSMAATLTVNIPAKITQAPTNRFAVVGDSVTLAVSVAGSGPLSVQWQFNGTNIAGATNLTLTLSNVRLTQSGLYQVSVSNPFGSATTTVLLSVFPRPGMIVAWGDNSEGQADALAMSNAVQVAAGNYHSLALRSDGTVVGWGDNSFGQAVSPVGLSNLISIAAGDGFSMALTARGTVYAWGDNSLNQTNTPPSATNVIAIAAGQSHCLALRANGTVIAWGNNSDGQGQPISATDVKAIAAGEIHNLAVRRNGTVLGWGNNAYGQTTVPPNATNVIAVSAGYLHSLALRADGSIVAWGDNSFQQLAVPSRASNAVAIAAGELHSSALLADGAIVTWGDNSFGQTNLPSHAVGATMLASGYYHQVAIIELPELFFSTEANRLRLWWRGPHMLQRAALPTGPFVDFTQANPWTNTLPASNTFFRLRIFP